MTKQEIIADESKFQRVCGLWVSRNIGECVSSLMYDVGQNLEECARIFDFDYDEALGWFQSEDYEYVVDSFIDDADLDDLETIADMVEDWGNAIADVPTAVAVEDEPNDEAWVIESLGLRGDDEFDLNQEALEASIKEIRTKVKAMITSEAEYTEIGRHFNLECDYTEVYEHYIISERWTAELLRDHGQVVFDFGGLTIWGRMTTGQSISIDGVTARIIKGLDDDHYLWSEVQ